MSKTSKLIRYTDAMFGLCAWQFLFGRGSVGKTTKKEQLGKDGIARSVMNHILALNWKTKVDVHTCGSFI